MSDEPTVQVFRLATHPRLEVRVHPPRAAETGPRGKVVTLARPAYAHVLLAVGIGPHTTPYASHLRAMARVLTDAADELERLQAEAPPADLFDEGAIA